MSTWRAMKSMSLRWAIWVKDGTFCLPPTFLQRDRVRDELEELKSNSEADTTIG
jgi:hypothetical protein